MIAVDMKAAGGSRDVGLNPAANDLLVRWSVSKRVNSSRAEDEDAALIDQIELVVAK